MRKALGASLVVACVLLAAVAAQAKGPKTPITVQTGSGVLSASVQVTLCGAQTFVPCDGQTFSCPLIQLFGNDLIQKSTCGPAGFKVTGYSYSITIDPAGGCVGADVAGNTVVCGTAPATVSLTVGR